MIRRLSLRWRVAAAFGVGLALVMSVLAVATWNLTTGYMLDQREQSVTRQSEVNVRLVDAALAEHAENLDQLLTGLATGPDSSILLTRPAGWLTSGRTLEPSAVPAGLLDRARHGVAARQRFFAGGIPVLGVATPVGGDGSVWIRAGQHRDIPWLHQPHRAVHPRGNHHHQDCARHDSSARGAVPRGRETCSGTAPPAHGRNVGS